jgi:hypothetical protein
MIQATLKHSATRRALTLVARALKALINVYHTLFFIIPALQSENYNKKVNRNTFSEVPNLCH